MEELLDKIRALRRPCIAKLVRPIGIACMECVLSLDIPDDQRKICERVLALLRDSSSTQEQLRAAYCAAYAAYVTADYAAAGAAYSVYGAAVYAAAVAAAGAAAVAAAAAAYAAADAYAAAERNTAARELLVTKLMLLVG